MSPGFQAGLFCFVGYSVKTPAGQKGILLHELIKEVGSVFCFVCVINFPGKTLR